VPTLPLHAPADHWVSIIFAYRIASTLAVYTAATGGLHALRIWLVAKKTRLPRRGVSSLNGGQKGR